MKTTFIKPADIERKWLLIDAKDLVLGKVATKVAKLLIGKDKVIFSRDRDVGDHVVVVNAAKVALTGNKAMDKKYYSHSGHPGNLKQISAQHLLEKNPTKLLFVAVKGMLPKNRLGREMIKRLRLYGDEAHQHEAQNPSPYQM